MSARHPAADRLPLGPATATGPTPLAGASLTPPPPTWTVTTAADPLPPGPSAAEVAAVRALPLGARRALCACSGPGWTVHPDGPVVPRLSPPPAELVGGAVVAWLPASEGEIIDAVARLLRSSRGVAVILIAERQLADESTTLRLAALYALNRWWP